MYFNDYRISDRICPGYPCIVKEGCPGNNFRQGKFISLIISVLILLSFLLLGSCSEDQISSSRPGPEINSVSDNTTFITDTVTFYGSNFGFVSDSSFILLSNGNKIKSSDCIKWTMILTRFVVPKGIGSGKFAIIIGIDTSNSVYLTVGALPPFEEVLISPGEFEMGSGTGLNDEMPVHKIRISRELYVSKFELSQHLWNCVSDTNPSIYANNSLPVHNVTWLDAVVFCNKISKIMKFDTCYSFIQDEVIWNIHAKGFRLPTEAEWEYICRGGVAGDFGGIVTPGEAAWYNLNSGGKPHEPGQKKANSSGLYDLHGNVREWCWDYYSAEYYTISPIADPAGHGSGTKHVARGGGWNDGNSAIRASNRYYLDSTITSCGIRLVRNK